MRIFDCEIGMSPEWRAVGNEFMLGLCLGTELSEGTYVHMPIDLLQEAAAHFLDGALRVPF